VEEIKPPQAVFLAKHQGRFETDNPKADGCLQYSRASPYLGIEEAQLDGNGLQKAFTTNTLCCPFRPTDFGGNAMTLRRLLFWIHLSIGVIIGFVIGFLAITGSILAFQPQIVAFAERSARITSPAQGSCVAPSDLLKNASDYRHGSASSLTLFSDLHRPGEVAFGPDSIVLINPCDGRVIGSGAGKLRGFFSSVRDLHRWVALNGVRHERLRSIKDACVVAFLFMILSGLVLWFPRKLTWQHIRPAVLFRQDLHGRAKEWNWHNVFGFWMAAPLAVIALSGTIMAYPWANALLYRVAGDHLSAERAEAEPTKRAKPMHADKFASLDAAIQAAVKQDAKWQSVEMRIPSEKDPNVAFRLEEGDGSNPRQRVQLVLARKDGHVVRTESFFNNSSGRQWRLYARFVHTGEMFGFIGRTVALLACMSALMLVWTGFSLSIRRFAFWRKRKASHEKVRRHQNEPRSSAQETASV
jgi:uncharacterized iron-regulated membrane protein